jgi:hypothetical protein
VDWPIRPNFLLFFIDAPNFPTAKPYTHKELLGLSGGFQDQTLQSKAEQGTNRFILPFS